MVDLLGRSPVTTSGRSRRAGACRRGCAGFHGPGVLPVFSFLFLIGTALGCQVTAGMNFPLLAARLREVQVRCSWFKGPLDVGSCCPGYKVTLGGNPWVKPLESMQGFGMLDA